MKTKKPQKSRTPFAKICIAVLEFIINAFLFLLHMMLTPKQSESSTLSDDIIDAAEQETIINSYSSKKRH